ncbi:MAG TPA: class I SAM-dependent methyltransferase [Desulfuromonadaceae bacterium]|jgi:2-polyprenyl-3-methyl-5-hydroxy-6-metoxy-1,4-benzoquinol methylase
MEVDKIKWNKRFASENSYLGERPSAFLIQEIERIKRLTPGKAALDVASGEGRNSVFLAQQGFKVTALDISEVGIDKGRKRALEAGVVIDFQQVDLDSFELLFKYDLIINFNFLLRPLIHKEVKALNPGGVILVDTIMQSPLLLARHNPDYLLEQGELLKIFEPFTGEIITAEELIQGDMPTARIFFKKTDKECMQT